MRIVLLGRPGSGKGTQARRLASERGLRHISTGDLLRQAIAAQSPLGRHVAVAVERGELVEDSVVSELLASALRDAPDVVLDGFPRTVAQAVALEVALGPVGIDAAIEIDVPPATLIERIRRRRVCNDCGASGTNDDGACGGCGGTMLARSDDDTDVLLRRLWDFERVTRPAVDWLAGRVPVLRVPGTGSPQRVAAHIDDVLAELSAWRTDEELPLAPSPCR